MYGEEEEFLQGYIQKGEADDYIRRIAPYAIADQVRVPWCGGKNGNLRA